MKLAQTMRRARFAALASAALILAGALAAGCGKKGDLTLPPDDSALAQPHSSQNTGERAAHDG